MNYEDIKIEYKCFIKQIFNTSSILMYLISDLEKYISEYYKDKNFDEIFADNLEINLAYLKDCYFKLDYAIEKIKDIQLASKKIKEEQNSDNLYVLYPQTYDDIDILISKDAKLDINIFKNNTKN